MQKTAHILICDDQPIIHESLGVYLESEGFTHASAYNGVQAVQMAESESPDLILMDLMMPEKSGIDACREIRQKSSVPIIMLTAKGEEIDRVVGLELGADDYMVKPISYDELLARAEAIIRRTHGRREAGAGILSFHQFSIDTVHHTVKRGEEKIELSSIEYAILLFMVKHPGELLLYHQIYEQVWSSDSLGDIRTVMVHISNLRKKIDPDHSGIIETVRGAGYIFSDV